MRLLGSVLERFWGPVRHRFRVAAVESIETFARAAASRFLARTICDLLWAGVAASDDLVLEGKGALSLGGACWRGVVEVVDLGLSGEASVGEWEAAIEGAQQGGGLLFTDGSRDETDMLGEAGGVSGVGVGLWW